MNKRLHRGADHPPGAGHAERGGAARGGPRAPGRPHRPLLRDQVLRQRPPHRARAPGAGKRLERETFFCVFFSAIFL